MKSKATYHELFADLQENNTFFDQLVDIIPTKLYIAGQSGDDYNPKYFKGQSKENKEARRAKSKQAKRAKFDPALAETTTQVKQRLDSTNSSSIGKPTGNSNLVSPKPQPPAGIKKRGELTSSSSSNNNDNTSSFKAVNPSDSDTNKSSRIEALREKLRAKLAEKRGERPSDPNNISKRAARRAEKKKRQEAAIKRNKKKSTSNAERTDSKTNDKYSMSLNNGKGGGGGSDDPATDLSQVDFGRLAGLNNPIRTGNYSEVNKALKNLSKSKNLEKLLADAERKKERLEELKKSDKQEDKDKISKIQWGNIIKEATGERVKDDPAKIRKALKRKAVKKQKSTKAWKTRMESTQEKMDEKQKIRNHNLNKRKSGGSTGANLSSKRIELEGDNDTNADSNKKPKNGRRLSRAGFEGRKQDFLNKKER